MGRLSEVSSDFSQDLHSKLLVSDSNCIFSGYGIFLPLDNLLYGASGPTVDQMYDVTQVYRFKGGKMKSHEANRYALEQYRTNKTGGNASYAIYFSLKPGTVVIKDFTDVTNANYQSQVADHNLNDASGPEHIINDYFKNKTGDVIKDIVPPGVINSATQIVLASTFHISASWAKPFDKTKTQKANFTLATGQKVELYMMSDDYREAAYLSDFGGSMVIELPFLNHRFSLVCVLPPANRTLADEEKSILEHGKVLQMFRKLDEARADLLFQQKQHIKIIMPKMKMQNTYAVKPALIAMGMTKPFDPTQANFQALTKTGKPYVSEIYHQVDFETNENGTAGAPAATPQNQFHLGTGSPTIRLNRPYIFFLRDKDRNIILFQGRLVGK
ncbi:hypothetical protein BsWGS_21478 [Bradybaena similaris]